MENSRVWALMIVPIKFLYGWGANSILLLFVPAERGEGFMKVFV